MVPPAVVAASPLAAPASGGFVDVDKFTLQHKRYANIFALGDSASVPTSRTIAAITAQAPVVVHNVIMSIRSEADALDRPMARYDGYSSSPILTKRGGLILAEFKYDGGIKETFPLWFDQTKEVSLFYSLFTGFFPYAYCACAASIALARGARLGGLARGDAGRAVVARAPCPCEPT
jgi:sulfide:quinone oxidoreductase